MSSPTRSLPLFLCLLTLPTSGARAQGQTVPKADREAEERRIRELDRRWATALAKKDVGTVVGFYAPEGRIMPSNAPTARGRTAIAEFWNGVLKLPEVRFTFEPETIEVAEAGDLAYDVGTYSLSYDGPRGRVQDRGKYLVVWKKIDGDWKAMVDIDNSDSPAP